MPRALPRQALIPANYSRLVARELGLRLEELPRLLRSTRLSVEQFFEPELLLTAEQQLQVLENALELDGDGPLGLRMGRRLTPATHGPVGFMASSSPDLLTALEAFCVFLPTRMSLIRLELRDHGEHLECVVDIEPGVSEGVARCLSEICAVGFHEIAGFVRGERLEEAHVRFAHDAPSYRDVYPDYLPGSFEFSASVLSAMVPNHLCREPNVSANHDDYSVAHRRCQALLAQLHEADRSYRSQVERMMLSHRPGALQEEDAAAALLVSKRTLARRLREEGTSFRGIRDEVLSRLASEYLVDDDLSVEAVAALLDFHDKANFRRAFKRWFRVTPDAYRRQRRPGSDRP